MPRLGLAGACLAGVSAVLAVVPSVTRPDVELCKCWCGAIVRAPCPDIEARCQRLCSGEGDRPRGRDVPPPPPPPPTEVVKLREAREALDRGDLEAAMRALQAAKAANRCFAPAFQMLGDLYLRAPSRWSCALDGEPATCEEIAAYELWWGATGCDGRMEGLDGDGLARLRARAAPLYEAAHQARSRRLAKRVLAAGDVKLKAGDAAGAESEYRYVIGLFQGAIRPGKEDADHAAAYAQLSAALAAQGRDDEALKALEDWEETPYARAYGVPGTSIGRMHAERKRDLQGKTGCQFVMVNKTSYILDLYLSPGGERPECRALAWKDAMVEPPPGAACFCYVHRKPGTTYVLSVKRVFQEDGKERMERAFWQNSGGAYFCKAGEIHTWTVRDIGK